MKVYVSELSGSYCSGLAIVFANSPTEAAKLLNNGTSTAVERLAYPDEQYDYRPSYEWSWPKLDRKLSTNAVKPAIHYEEIYIE